MKDRDQKWEDNEKIVSLVKTKIPESSLNQEKFEIIFQKIIKNEIPESRSVFGYVNRTISQFNLKGIYESSDILMEVYTRARSCNQVIDNPIAWIRATAFYVICELNRKKKTEIKLVLEVINQQTINQFGDQKNFSDVLEDNLNRVIISFNSLDPREKEIFQWRLIQNLSWKDIQDIFYI